MRVCCTAPKEGVLVVAPERNAEHGGGVNSQQPAQGLRSQRARSDYRHGKRVEGKALLA